MLIVRASQRTHGAHSPSPATDAATDTAAGYATEEHRVPHAILASGVRFGHAGWAAAAGEETRAAQDADIAAGASASALGDAGGGGEFCVAVLFSVAEEEEGEEEEEEGEGEEGAEGDAGDCAGGELVALEGLEVGGAGWCDEGG
ncbi:hypothetical protein LTR91_002856 [Friedmanniomyces endolithicus]|uniref:Uncharacterized protein n=1 Tax=Friedmanniomyces endolithicus TaxID=329885 RepID=A0AAN6L0Y0_9PEZI|nr:hypothetical protein LTR94_001069 [Friedmanniomyces endolithicus]KAK0813253.1 hypothetical protein LTR38_003049 [Friedmanniomyces endolithicus]KAK0815939.1 hypothetical protein LTR59_000312 [Friedmanniomyces endolithicus]KAK0818072.1 hypothetical protein LTR75_002790 [Friedmanniomyces endolithicus]KAK0843698.1 hypothetical protein LTR03_008511 [Friedmanniomyces endolithicus]